MNDEEREALAAVVIWLASAVQDADRDYQQECKDAEHDGERPDLNDYEIAISLQDARAILAGMRVIWS